MHFLLFLHTFIRALSNGGAVQYAIIFYKVRKNKEKVCRNNVFVFFIT